MIKQEEQRQAELLKQYMEKHFKPPNGTGCLIEEVELAMYIDPVIKAGKKRDYSAISILVSNEGRSKCM
ncbi:hypothetical protein [Paenibacillus sp. EKM211P]|uniref:hypothetical protein n=1 Tax=Paenibacillus sp. EKM211P TaxID=1683679 RepID=UPI0013E902DA|nr:hypothetical protein [Paenibacillus sp. EKM211P]KAF6582195.1 hypothetical protein G9G57_19275 [Paenibacillus sp. EKM211P]